LSNCIIDELVDEKVGFHLEKKTSPKIFAEKVKKICSLTQKEYEILCHQARKKVAHLDWSEIVKQTTQVYQKLMAEKKMEDKESKVKGLKEILALLPPSKFKSFLQNQFQKPEGKMIPQKSLWLLVVTVMATFFMGIIFWFLNKTKRISPVRIKT